MIAIYIDNQLSKFEAETKYSFDYLFRTMGYEYKYIHGLDQMGDNDILFYYGLIAPTEKEIYALAFQKIVFFIPADPDLFQPGNINKDELAEWKRSVKYLENTPILSKKKIDLPIFYYKNDDLFYGNFAFDLIGNIFFHLVNSEESIFFNRDSLDRFPDSLSIFNDEAMYPFINKYLWLVDEILLDSIKERKEYFLLRKEYWPKGEDFAVAISHNVNRVKKWTFGSLIKSTLTDFLVFYKLKYVINNALSRLKYIITNIEEYWNFEFIDELENQFDFKSTYFFGMLSKSDNFIDYNIDEDDIREEITRLMGQGNEIALLGSVESAKADILENEKKILEDFGQENIGIRQTEHIYDQKITTEFHNKHKIYYDSTRSFVHQVGYKNGLGLPFYNFTVLNIDIQNNEKKCLRSSCLEIPVNFSDEILKLSKYKRMPYDEAKETLMKLIDIAQHNKSLLNLNFSTNNFTDIPYNEELQRLLHEKLMELNVFKTNLLGIAQWWRRREAVVVKEGQYGYSIYFPHDIDNFSLRFHGNYQIYEIEGADNKIEGNSIQLKNIKADSTVRIRIKAEEPINEE